MASTPPNPSNPPQSPLSTAPPKPAPSVRQPLTIRNAPFTYMHLALLSSSSSSGTLDILTASTYLTSALQQFLGVTGTAIPVDFLQVENQEVWVRVPREDGAAVVGALSGWVGGKGVAWRILGRGDWLGSVVAGTGRDLFES